jgi:uncharacterized protein (DUF1501 family)
MSISRRFFLGSCGVALAGIGLDHALPSFLQRTAAAQNIRAYGKRKTIVAIFQRGAVDGLNMVVPYGESDYYRYRPNIAIAKPGSRGELESVIALDSLFGLHPSLRSFKPLWDSKRLAIVHAVGSPDNTRSHFDAQDYMESGTPGIKSTADGWLNRYLQTKPDKENSPFRAVAIADRLPRSLYGRFPSLAIQNLSTFDIRAGRYSSNIKKGFEDIYDQSVNDALHGTGKETFEAIDFLKRVNPSQYKPENGAIYPRSRFGQSLLQISQLIKAGVGLEVAFAESKGWDTHNNEGGATGQLSNLLLDFSTAISAFVKDLGTHMDDVLILTMSEFGRTARENGSRGTDHGHATAMFAIGNSVKGGHVYGNWPGLKSDDLYEGRDLALTTDFRDLFTEVVQKHLGNSSKEIFPGYQIDKRRFRGVIT